MRNIKFTTHDIFSSYLVLCKAIFERVARGMLKLYFRGIDDCLEKNHILTVL